MLASSTGQPSTGRGGTGLAEVSAPQVLLANFVGTFILVFTGFGVIRRNALDRWCQGRPSRSHPRADTGPAARGRLCRVRFAAGEFGRGVPLSVLASRCSYPDNDRGLRS
jgi:hypothetical protein